MPFCIFQVTNQPNGACRVKDRCHFFEWPNSALKIDWMTSQRGTFHIKDVLKLAGNCIYVYIYNQ